MNAQNKFKICLAILIAAIASNANAQQAATNLDIAKAKAFGEYLASLVVLDYLSKGNCAYIFDKFPFSYHKELKNGLAALTPSFQNFFRKKISGEEFAQMKKDAIYVHELTMKGYSKEFDEKTACGIKLGYYWSGYYRAKEILEK